MKKPYYTHAGFFHADEVAGYAICQLAGLTNRFERLSTLDDLPSDGILADIGRVYDPPRLMFDHHQGFLQRPNGVPYATAGLLWRYCGFYAVNKVVSKSPGRIRPGISEIERIAARVDATLIEGLDAHDADSEYKISATCSGGKVRPLTISHIIAGMNGHDVADHKAQELKFKDAVSIVKGILESHINAAAKFVGAQSRFDEALERPQAEIAILRAGLPWGWEEIICDYPEVIFVIGPSKHPGNPWSMIAVPVEPESREVKLPIERPEWFAGFIHQGKWIAGAASVEELIELAKHNLNNRPT